MATTWTQIADGEAGEYTDIRYEKSGAPEGIAKLTIARPEVRNAFRPRTIIELSAALTDAREDARIGVIVLTGEGPDAFSLAGPPTVTQILEAAGFTDVATKHVSGKNWILATGRRPT